ncbi:MAG TPA: redoxin domain-containing protein [Bryobacteraceae bacterium]|jgi:peroxiredoxin
MSDTLPHDLAEKAAAMLAFRQARDSGLPVPPQVRARHVWATNDGYSTGPDPGERIPEFALPDQWGALRTLNDLAGPNGLFLVFHRSAHWCQYCRSQLVELEQSRTMLERNGVQIAAISFDSQEILAAFAQEYSIGYPQLSDKGSVVIRKFGIFNYNVAPDMKRNYGIPHPVEYLVAPDGTVVKKYFVPNYQHRVAGSAVALREFGTVASDAPVVTLESGAVAVQIGFPSPRVFAAQEVSFFANFALEPGWHVYGTQGGTQAGTPLPEAYTATSIVFEDPRVIRCQLELPAPEMLEIPALNETLPVYSGSFRAIGTLLLKYPLPEGRLVLRGHLAFQQCSETVCEAPHSMSFELALQVEPFVISDRERLLLEQQKRSA